MADENIKITIDDDGTPDSDVTQSDTLSSADEDIQKTLDELNLLSSSTSDTSDNFASLDTQIEELNEALGSLIDTINLAGLNKNSDALGEFGSSLIDTTDNFDALEAANRELQEQLHDLIDETEETSESISGLNKDIFKTIRQITNMGRAADIIPVRVNQMAQAAAVMGKTMSGAALGLGLLAAGIATTVIAINGLTKAADNFAKEMGGFSAEVTEAAINRSLEALEDRIRFAEESGQSAAQFIEASNELSEEVREFKRTVMKVLLPILTLITNFFTGIMKIINDIVELIKWFTSLFEPFFYLVDLILEVLPDFIKEWFKKEKEDIRKLEFHEYFTDLFNPSQFEFKSRDTINKSFLERDILNNAQDLSGGVDPKDL